MNRINQMEQKVGHHQKSLRCEAIFSPQNLKECKAKGITCSTCGKRVTSQNTVGPKERGTLQRAAAIRQQKTKIRTKD